MFLHSLHTIILCFCMTHLFFAPMAALFPVLVKLRFLAPLSLHHGLFSTEGMFEIQKCLFDIYLRANKLRVSSAAHGVKGYCCSVSVRFSSCPIETRWPLHIFHSAGSSAASPGSRSALRLLSRWEVEFPSISPDCGSEQSHVVA